jgi:hypothetical protein
MKAEHVKTAETTEAVSLHRVEKCVKRHNCQRSAPFAREKPGADWKKSLPMCGAGRKSQKITQKAHAGRGPETKWEIPVSMIRAEKWLARARDRDPCRVLSGCRVFAEKNLVDEL